VCSLAANVVEPSFAADQRAYLADIAAAANRYQVSGVLNALGSVATVFGLVGVLHLLRGRRITLGQLGAGLVITGSVLLAGHWLIVLVETAGARGDRDRALQLLTTASQSPWGALVYVAALSLFLGPALMAVGLWTRRAAPVWVPIALLSYTAVAFLAPLLSPRAAPDTYQWRTSSHAIAVVSAALLGAALVGLALHILSVSDEAWARWQPLPETPRRRGAPSLTASPELPRPPDTRPAAADAVARAGKRRAGPPSPRAASEHPGQREQHSPSAARPATSPPPSSSH
jgi:hypothetical protein